MGKFSVCEKAQHNSITPKVWFEYMYLGRRLVELCFQQRLQRSALSFVQ